MLEKNVKVLRNNFLKIYFIVVRLLNIMFSLLDFKCTYSTVFSRHNVVQQTSRTYSSCLLKCYTCWLEILFLAKISELLAFREMLSNCLANHYKDIIIIFAKWK